MQALVNFVWFIDMVVFKVKVPESLGWSNEGAASQRKKEYSIFRLSLRKDPTVDDTVYKFKRLAQKHPAIMYFLPIDHFKDLLF